MTSCPLMEQWKNTFWCFSHGFSFQFDSTRCVLISCDESSKSAGPETFRAQLALCPGTPVQRYDESGRVCTLLSAASARRFVSMGSSM